MANKRIDLGEWAARFGMDSAVSARRSPVREKKELVVVPFRNFPEIRYKNSSYNPALVGYLKSRIDSSTDLEEAVAAILLNTLSSLENKVVSQNKSNTRDEREYIKKQLTEYLSTIPVMEIAVPDDYDREMLGNFAKKERHNINSADLLMKLYSANWNGNHQLVYLNNIEGILNPDIDEIKYEILQGKLKKYEKELMTVGAEINKLEEKPGYRKVSAALSQKIEKSYKFSSEAPSAENLKKAIELLEQEKPSVVRDTVLKSINFLYKCFSEAEEEFSKCPSGEKVLQSIVQNVEKGGFLLIDSREQRNIESMKYAGLFGRITMYQKQ